MQKSHILLAICVLILLGLILYSWWSGENLGWWLKGWSLVCVAVYMARLYEKYRKNRED
ncbi:MAG TPA: hypothetical protein VF199_05445 [Bacillales bacterium]